METELIKALNGVLKSFPQFWDGEKLHRSLVIDAINQKEPTLIKALINNDKIKENYSSEIDGVLLFDFEKLISLLKYKEFWYDSFTKYRNTIGLTSEGKYLNYNSDVVLDFPFKDCVLEGGMTKEDQGKDEIYYNEVIARDEIDRLFAPKVLTKAKRYTKDGIEENITDFSDVDNLIIKGNNLIALHSLKERYAGKVKLIYIDPPYNTGNDSFKYNDRFNRSTWLTFMKNRLEIARDLLSDDGMICVQCDDNEQAYLKILMDEVFENRFLNNVAVKMSEASGVKMNHAKGRFPKLKEFILMYKMPNFKGFITVDKYEQKEWDPENNIFIDNLTEEQRSKLIDLEAKEINDDTDVITANEILKKAKKISLATKLKELDFENENEKTEWLFKNSYRIIKTAGSSSLATLVKSLNNVPKQDIAAAVSKKGVLFFYITDFNKDTKQPRLQVIFADSNIFKNPCDFWQDIKTTGAIAEEGGVKLSNGKKPEKILYRLIKMITNEGDVVLDYHLGSGTTAAVAHKMGRRYIGIEQMDYGENDSVIRLKNVINGDDTGISSYEDVNWKGGGSFVYVELMELNYRFIHQIEKAQDYEALTSILEEMKVNAHLNYHADLNKVLKTAYEMDGMPRLVSFDELELHEQKKLLIELLDKNQLYVSLSEINDKTLHVSDEDKAFNRSFYKKD